METMTLQELFAFFSLVILEDFLSACVVFCCEVNNLSGKQIEGALVRSPKFVDKPRFTSRREYAGNNRP